MSLEEYYLYAINCNEVSFDADQTLTKLDKILSSGYIYSRRNLGDIDLNKGGWQGLDFISLCDYSKKDLSTLVEDYTAYNTYIRNSLSFILNKERIKAINPILMPPVIFDWGSLQNMKVLGNHPQKRFSDLPDELQVKNKISLTRLKGITLPISLMIKPMNNEAYSKEMILNIIENIKFIMKKHNINKLVYDVDTLIELNSINDIDRSIELLHKKPF